jgi:hypothetical protein
MFAGLGRAMCRVTMVRGLLLPAVMSLLGEWNWWAPGRLRRLHYRVVAARTDPPPAAPGSAGPGWAAVGPAAASHVADG